MRLSYEEFKAAIDATPQDDFLTNRTWLERAYQNVKEADALKVNEDRRDDLLGLSSRLAVAFTGREEEPLVYVGPGETFDEKMDARRKAMAANFVQTAAAIIAEVDRVSGEVKS